MNLFARWSMIAIPGRTLRRARIGRASAFWRTSRPRRVARFGSCRNSRSTVEVKNKDLTQRRSGRREVYQNFGQRIISDERRLWLFSALPAPLPEPFFLAHHPFGLK